MTVTTVECLNTLSQPSVRRAIITVCSVFSQVSRVFYFYPILFSVIVCSNATERWQPRRNPTSSSRRQSLSYPWIFWPVKTRTVQTPFSVNICPFLCSSLYSLGLKNKYLKSLSKGLSLDVRILFPSFFLSNVLPITLVIHTTQFCHYSSWLLIESDGSSF
jgi:hypothetical protein